MAMVDVFFPSHHISLYMFAIRGITIKVGPLNRYVPATTTTKRKHNNNNNNKTEEKLKMYMCVLFSIHVQFSSPNVNGREKFSR